MEVWHRYIEQNAIAAPTSWSISVMKVTSHILLTLFTHLLTSGTVDHMHWPLVSGQQNVTRWLPTMTKPRFNLLMNSQPQILGTKNISLSHWVLILKDRRHDGYELKHLDCSIFGVVSWKITGLALNRVNNTLTAVAIKEVRRWQSTAERKGNIWLALSLNSF